jgi:DNA-directed RNA polymerase specialized sigma24 family protein
VTDRRTDFELVAYTIGRDQGALAAVYDRFADEVFDLCCSVTRDRGLAEDATAETFLAVWARVEQLADPWQLRLWVLALARRMALRHAGRPSGVPITTVPEHGDVAVDAPGGDAATNADSAVDAPSTADQQLAWDAAGALAPSDRVVLDLQLRRHLKASPRAKTLGLTIDEGRPLTAQARADLEAGVQVLGLARRRRTECAGLGRALAGWDGKDTPRFRKDLARHCARCETCRTAVPVSDPFAAFGAIPLSQPQPALRGRVLDALDDPPPIAPWSPGPGGFPPASPETRAAATAVAPSTRPRWLLAVAAAALALVVGGVAWFALRARDDEPTTASTTAQSTVTPTEPSTTPQSTAAAGPKPAITGADVTPARISSTECPNSPQILTVTATATDDGAVTGATVTASRGGARTEQPMTLSDGTWRTEVGPFGPGIYGSVSLRIVVTDADGNEDSTLRYAQLSRACI